MPWRWAENGSVLVWCDGSTVAFREEVVQVLGSLSPHGLPPFGAVVLLFAACRGLVPTAAQVVGDPSEDAPTPASGPRGAILSGAREQRLVRLEEELDPLRRVRELPAELRQSVRAKCVLAEAVFEGLSLERHGTPALLRHMAAAPFRDEELNVPDGTPPGTTLVLCVHLVSAGLRAHSRGSLELRLRTNLDALPEPPAPQTPPAEQARELLQELLEDPEQRLVGLAARELMVAARLPRRLTVRETLAVGGVADISNRGPLDRLLLSELAHDDLTLTLRIALNEALYLRHEPPESEPPASLAILLDSGLRLWGLPRLFATSAALALVAGESRTVSVRAWRAHGRELRAVDLLDRTSLLNHLGELETEAHPGDALPAFAELLGGDPGSQAVLVTHPDVLGDAEFRRALSAMAPGPGFVATVDRDGRFALHAPPFSPRQPLVESRLDLEKLFAVPRSAARLRRPASDPNLPALLQVDPCPLLLPVAGVPEFWVTHEGGGTTVVLKDRRLATFRAADHGGRVVIPRLPGVRTLWMEQVEGVVYLVRASANQRPARLISIPQGHPHRVVDLCAGEPALAAVRSGSVVLVIRERDVCAFALSDGRQLDRALSPHRWHRGRFFGGGQKYFFVHWTGHAIRFDPVTLPPRIGDSPIVTIFDREGVDGPWILNQVCQVLSLASAERAQVPLPLGQAAHHRSVQVSRDGHRIHVSIPDLDWHILFDLATGRSERQRGPLEHLELLDPPPVLPARNLLRNFDALCVAPGEPLGLRSRKGTWRQLVSEADGRMRLRPLTTAPAGDIRPFQQQPTALWARYGCTLDTVQWASGSRAFLDSRGLLHLKSHNPALPEISLVLDAEEVAAWCSDQHGCGPAFFNEGTFANNPALVMNHLQAFLEQA
jgi:hypothetical protein